MGFLHCAYLFLIPVLAKFSTSCFLMLDAASCCLPCIDSNMEHASFSLIFPNITHTICTCWMFSVCISKSFSTLSSSSCNLGVWKVCSAQWSPVPTNFQLGSVNGRCRQGQSMGVNKSKGVNFFSSLLGGLLHIACIYLLTAPIISGEWASHLRERLSLDTFQSAFLFYTPLGLGHCTIPSLFS